MRVALILTGHLRCFEEGYKSFKEHLLDKVPTDVFISTWDEIGYYTGKGYKKTRADGFIDLEETDQGFVRNMPVDLERVKELYQPKAMDVEHFPDVEDRIAEKVKEFKNAYTRPKNTAAQFYKIARGIRLFQDWAHIVNPLMSNYDYVIRARPDLVIQSDLHFPEWYKPGLFYYNPGRNPRGIGYGDQLHITSVQHMLLMVNLYYNLEIFYGLYGYSCPHLFIQEYLKHMNIPAEEIRVPTKIQHTPNGPYKEWDTGVEHKPEN